jgi:L-ascorbate 6-phosphate lactonase
VKLIEKMNQLQVKAGQIALFYLSQAGICIKTSDNKLIVVDAYLSDACERMFGFKRMIPPVLEAGELDADLFVSTHSHADHLDPDALPVVVKNRKTFFVGSPDCEEAYTLHNLSHERYKILKEGEEWETKGVRFKAIFADHGDLAPDAVGLLIDIDGIKIYHTGDTSFCPDQINASLNTNIDIMIAPINGQYGNMNAGEACALAAVVKPKIVIASHFWMFLEHVCEGGKGDPTLFLSESAALSGDIKAKVMAPGELLMYPNEEKKDEPKV